MNNRQTATVLWGLIVLVCLLYRKETRIAFGKVLIAFLHPKVVSCFIAMTLYVFLFIAIFAQIGLWTLSVYTDSVFWYLGTACVLLLNINRINQEDSCFSKIVRENLKLIVVLEFLIGLYSFSLVAELFLVPIIFVVVAMQIMTARDLKYQQVKKSCDFLLSAFGIFLIVFTISEISLDPLSLYSQKALYALLTIPLLTLAYLPFLYLVAVWMLYENISLHFRVIFKLNTSFTRRAMWKTVLLCNVNLHRLRKLSQAITKEIPKLSGEAGIERILSELESEVALDLQAMTKRMLLITVIISVTMIL